MVTKGNFFIKTWFQRILVNTNVWLASKGIWLKELTIGLEEDIMGPIGKISELRTKNKQDHIASAATPRFNFIVGKGKGKEQVESSTPSAQEKKELEVLGEHLDYEPPNLGNELVDDEVQYEDQPIKG